MLIGRVTYESFGGGVAGARGEFADRMNVMPKYVVSSTLADPAWNNTTVMSGDVAELTALKESVAGGLLVVAAARSSTRSGPRISSTNTG